MEFIKVSGRIVSELSEKVPNYLVALNELIKNAYDSGSPSVSITLDTRNLSLVIVDKGKGMNLDDIRSLIHISKSNKEYARVLENGRIVQGSKGLGFLSVFKFGSIVKWSTLDSEGVGRVFEFDYDSMINQEDITDYGIDIKEVDNLDHGTKIEITLDVKNGVSLSEYFGDEKNINKVIYSFTPENFEVNMSIDDEHYTNKPGTNFTEILKDRQLFNIRFSTDDNQLQFYRGTHKLCCKKLDIKNDGFKVNLSLVAFSLRKNDKKKISSLYYNYFDELTPLIYINTNLFNNYDLFNPNIMLKVKFSNILNQQIGNIEIFSADKRLDFNSDRTNFIQNPFTDGIINFLKELNIEIQKQGSEIKPHLINQDFLTEDSIIIYENEAELNDDLYKKNIKPTFFFKNDVVITPNGTQEVNYKVFDFNKTVKLEKKKSKIQNATKQLCAEIILTKSYDKIETNNGQIDLKKYISKITDSKGKTVSTDEVEVFVDGIKSNWILGTIQDPRVLCIRYEYVDPDTKLCAAEVRLEFYNKELKIRKPDDILIHNPIKNGYQLKNKMFTSKIVDQLNSISDIEKYDAVVASALRSVYETAIDELQASGKYKTLLSQPGLEDRVKKIIEYAHSNSNKILNTIDNATNLSYKNLHDNIYDSDNFVRDVRKCHRGAHKSMKYLKHEDLRSIGQNLSYFLILIDFML